VVEGFHGVEGEDVKCHCWWSKGEPERHKDKGAKSLA